jgi:hypothetical protein
MTRSILFLSVVLVMATSRQVASSATRTSRPAFVDEAEIAMVAVRPVAQHRHAAAPSESPISAITLADHRYAERTRSTP